MTLPGSGGSPSLVLLKGITRLEVDRRTNVDAAVLGLAEPSAEDREELDLAALRAADSACALRGAPTGYAART